MTQVLRRFADFVRDLQNIDRSALRGDALLDPFVRHTGCAEGALYLRDARDSALRLAAKTQQFLAPAIAQVNPRRSPREPRITRGGMRVPHQQDERRGAHQFREPRRAARKLA